MENKEKLTERLRAIRILSEEGSPGEREAAQEVLSRQMQKYSITESDLQDEQKKLNWFSYKTDSESRLLAQIIYMIMGVCNTYTRKTNNRRERIIGVECTTTQQLEIDINYEFFKQAMNNELKIFYNAFVQKNNLFPPPELASKNNDKSDLSKEEQMKMFFMMQGIDRRAPHKQIEGGKNGG